MEEKEFTQLLKTVTDKICKEYHPEKIILYGSYAYGNPTRHSDIDLFIVKKTSLDWLKRFVKVKEIIFDKTRKIPISPNVYTPEELEDRLISGDSFIKEIMEKGKVLYVS